MTRGAGAQPPSVEPTVGVLDILEKSGVYLFGFVALRWRATRTLGRGRPSAAVGFALLTAAATHVSALAALAFVTVAWGALHAYELIGWREERARRRSELAPESGFVETHT